jgi:hypothetical protein
MASQAGRDCVLYLQLSICRTKQMTLNLDMLGLFCFQLPWDSLFLTSQLQKYSWEMGALIGWGHQ